MKLILKVYWLDLGELLKAARVLGLLSLLYFTTSVLSASSSSSFPTFNNFVVKFIFGVLGFLESCLSDFFVFFFRSMISFLVALEEVFAVDSLLGITRLFDLETGGDLKEAVLLRPHDLFYFKIWSQLKYRYLT